MDFPGMPHPCSVQGRVRSSLGWLEMSLLMAEIEIQGPFQPKTFHDSVTSTRLAGRAGGRSIS